MEQSAVRQGMLEGLALVMKELAVRQVVLMEGLVVGLMQVL